MEKKINHKISKKKFCRRNFLTTVSAASAGLIFNPFRKSKNLYAASAHGISAGSAQEIETIAHGFVSAGEHQIQWSLNNRQAGMYFCKLEAGKYSEIIKLIFYK